MVSAPHYTSACLYHETLEPDPPTPQQLNGVFATPVPQYKPALHAREAQTKRLMHTHGTGTLSVTGVAACPTIANERSRTTSESPLQATNDKRQAAALLTRNSHCLTHALQHRYYGISLGFAPSPTTFVWWATPVFAPSDIPWDKTSLRQPPRGTSFVLTADPFLVRRQGRYPSLLCLCYPTPLQHTSPAPLAPS